MPDSDIPPFAQAAAGATGSIVSNTIVYPLDLISTRLQTARKSSVASGSGSRASKASLYQAFKEIVDKKGVAGLYQGLGTDNLSNTLSNFLFFFFRAAITERIHARQLQRAPSTKEGKRPSTVPLTPAQDLAAGALAGICSRAFTTPLSNVTVRKQTHSSSSKQQVDGKGKEKATTPDDDSSDDEGTFEDEPSIMSIVNEILKDKGVIGLWSGFESAVLLSITPAITFYLTNVYTRLLLPKNKRESPSSWQIFFLSALGNASSTTLLFPLILAKTLLQYRSPSGRRVYNSLPEVFIKVVQKKGVIGLYQGLESQLLKGIISHGVTMTVKDRVEDLFVQAFLAMRRRRRIATTAASN